MTIHYFVFVPCTIQTFLLGYWQITFYPAFNSDLVISRRSVELIGDPGFTSVSLVTSQTMSQMYRKLH